MKGKWRLPWKSKRLLFLLPGFSGVMLFYLLPFFEVVRRSFFQSGNSAFVGLYNYRTVFENGAFVLAVRNTLLYMAMGGATVDGNQPVFVAAFAESPFAA